MRRIYLAIFAAMSLASVSVANPSAPAPKLEYAFSAKITLMPPVEQGEIDGKRARFIAITGGSVSGPRLSGEVLAGGGDWQSIGDDGLTSLSAKYFLRAEDGAVIGVTNVGVRVAPPEIIEQLANGQIVDPSLYYFRTTPSFEVANGPHEWLRRKTFVARGIRKPDHVIIDFYIVE